MSLHSIDPSAMFPRPSTSSMRRLFGVFWPGVLIDSTVFFSRFCVDSITVRVRAHARYIRGVSEPILALLRVSALLPGELGFFLTCSDASGSRGPFVSACAILRPWQVSQELRRLRWRRNTTHVLRVHETRVPGEVEYAGSPADASRNQADASIMSNTSGTVRYGIVGLYSLEN